MAAICCDEPARGVPLRIRTGPRGLAGKSDSEDIASIRDGPLEDEPATPKAAFTSMRFETWCASAPGDSANGVAALSSLGKRRGDSCCGDGPIRTTGHAARRTSVDGGPQPDSPFDWAPVVEGLCSLGIRSPLLTPLPTPAVAPPCISLGAAAETPRWASR